MTVMPRCSFAVRYPAGNGKWRYQRVSVDSGPLAGYAPMTSPPIPGDLITLHGRPGSRPEEGPVFRVVERMFTYPSYGSGSWPYGKTKPEEGPLIDFIVEPAQGLYRDETDACGADECDAFVMNGEWQLPAGAAGTEPHEHFPYEPAN